MDVIGVFAAGVREVVASCGTSLTSQQVQAMRRHSDKHRGQLRSGRRGRQRGRALHQRCCSKRACTSASWSSTAASTRTSTARSAAPDAYRRTARRRQGLLLLAGGPRARALRHAHRGREGRRAAVSAARGAAHHRQARARDRGQRRWRATWGWNRAWCWSTSARPSTERRESTPARRPRIPPGRRRRFCSTCCSASPEAREPLLPALRTARRRGSSLPRAASFETIFALDDGGRQR